MNGKPRGPWQCARVCYFIDLETMAKFTFVSGTVGTDVGVRVVRDKIRMMRRLRGEGCYPVVLLQDAFMPTRFGGRQRPDFKVMRWITLRPGNEALPAPAPNLLGSASTGPKPAEETKPAPEVKPATVEGKPASAANKRGVVKTAPKKAQPVSEPTWDEVLGDSLPDNLK
jgi:hypothetical protein